MCACACSGSEVPADCESILPPQMAIAAAQGDLSLDFSVDIAAAGVSVTGGVGTFDGMPLVVYERQPWPATGYTLFQGLAVDQEAWHVVWFYCSGGRLVALYRESTTGGGAQPMDVSGTCVEQDGVRTEHVELPPVDLVLPVLVAGYSISGPDIELGCSSPGRVNIGGRQLQLLVFGAVDCRDCGAPGWRELHAILWDADEKRACFGILYLVSPGQVLLQYALSLPDLADPGPLTFSATWSAP